MKFLSARYSLFRGISTLLFVMTLGNLMGQQILFDKGVRVGEITAFPTLGNESEHYYLADKIQLAKHPDGTPMFSFVRYVKNSSDASSSSGSSIQEANQAGGIVHAVVALDVPKDMIREAERQLQRLRPGAKLMGPIIYKSGQISLISSVAAEGGKLTEKVVGIGSAPILEGQKAAISVLLTKEGSDILWATFQSPTPDLSFQFDMTARGYLSPKNVTIEANFDQIYKHNSFEGAVVTPVLAAEIKAAFDDLKNSGAIKVTQVGEDASLDKMRETAYNQLISLMFDKVGGQGVDQLSQLANSQNQKSMVDRATEMLSKARTEARTENTRIRQEYRTEAERKRRERQQARSMMDSIYRARGLNYTQLQSNQAEEEEDDGPEEIPVPGMAIAVSYQMKEVRRSGRYFVDLNKYTEDERSFPFSDNVGNVLDQCEACFVSRNLDDPLYKQRELTVTVDGINDGDFGNYVTNVEVLIKKEHQTGEITEHNILINKKSFNEAGNNFSAIYGWKNDNDREQWLDYQYKTRWSFTGGLAVETDWKSQDFAGINLYPPLEKKTIYLELDPGLVSKENIRAVEIKLFYKNGAKTKTKVINIRTASNVLSQSVEIILPEDKTNFDYEATFFAKGKVVKKPRQSYDAGYLYLESMK